jgi:amidase
MRPLDVSRRGALLGMAAAAATPPDICFQSAVEIASLIRTKKLSAREVLAAYLKQIERVNPKLNAIVTLVPDRAMQSAAAADELQAKRGALGPLHGLPIAHKDLVNTKGIRTTFGSPIFKDNIPATDDIIVERIRKGGAVLIGKTNTPEFGAGSQTFNVVFGATLNPYDTSKTVGGSSGGAACALASGMLPIADGSDLGGSLRNPAAFCNIVGFRPSPGRVPNGSFSPLSTLGPMGRSVADVALLLSAIAGDDPASPLSLPDTGSVFRQPLERSLKSVRVAWFKDLGGVPFDSRITTVVNAQRKVFEDLGCIVEQAEPDFTGADFAFKALRAYRSAATHGERVRTAQRSLYKDTLLREVEQGLALTSSDLTRAETLHLHVWHSFQALMSRYDYFVLPVTQLPAFDVKVPYPTEINGVRFDSYIDWMKACWYISLVGNPAISVPAGFTPEGLPVGLQIVGRRHQDFAVLQAAHAYEQATHHARRRPVL